MKIKESNNDVKNLISDKIETGTTWIINWNVVTVFLPD